MVERDEENQDLDPRERFDKLLKRTTTLMEEACDWCQERRCGKIPKVCGTGCPVHGLMEAFRISVEHYDRASAVAKNILDAISRKAELQKPN